MEEKTNEPESRVTMFADTVLTKRKIPVIEPGVKEKGINF